MLTKLKSHLTFILCFIGYNILMASLALVVFHKKVPAELKEKVIDRISIESIPANIISGSTAHPEKLDIDIKHTNLQKLAYVREISMQRGLLYDFAENDVSAVVRYNGESYRVGLGIKGMLRSHWENEDIYSLKIRVKDGKTIMGMRSFALQHPGTRGYLTEWIFHQLLHEADIVSLRYDYIAASINGKGSKIYALEEGFEKRLIEYNRHKEGPIFKFESNFRMEKPVLEEAYFVGTPQNLWAGVLTPMPKNATLSDTAMAQLFHKAKSLMEAFRQNRLSTSEVFDVKKLARYFALVELFGSHHSASLPNIRFYYNPITSLIEPIAHDNDHLDHLAQHGLLAEERQIGDKINFRPYGGWWKRTNWFERIFQDPEFYQLYMKSLEEISGQEFLDDFFEKNNIEIEQKRKILHRDYPILKMDPTSILYENQAYIRNMLDPIQFIHFNAKNTLIRGTELQLGITNTSKLAVEIVGLKFGDFLDLRPESTNILQAHIDSTPLTVLPVLFTLPNQALVADLPLHDLKVSYRIYGAERIFTTSIEISFIEEENTSPSEKDEMLSNIDEFDFLMIDKPRKVVQFKSGYHTLNKKMIIPSGFRVFASGGTEIEMRKNAYIHSFSPINFLGSKSQPIKLMTMDSTSRGILIQNAKAESHLEFVEFVNLSSGFLNGGKSSAMVVFDHSPVKIDKCKFFGSEVTDQLLEIISSGFTIDNTFFEGVKNSAFTASYSQGRLLNCHFISAAKCALSLPGSIATLENIIIKGSHANGLIATENSKLDINNIYIIGSDTAISSRDFSKIIVRNCTTENCDISYQAKTTNSAFGAALIDIKSTPSSPDSEVFRYSVDKENSIILLGKKLKSNVIKVSSQIAGD